MKNDTNQPNIYRDNNLVAAMGINAWLDHRVKRMIAVFTQVCCFPKLKMYSPLEAQLELKWPLPIEQAKLGLGQENRLSRAEKSYNIEDTYSELFEEKNRALKAQKESQNHLAQVASELTPTLNELGGLAQVSAAHWRTDFSNQDGKEFAERLEFTSQYVLSIVQDFADLAKLKTGNVAFNPQEVDPDELIKDAVSAVQGHADRLLVDLQSKPQMQNILIFGDLNRMRQLLLRALFIGIEFVGEDGFVRLRTELKSVAKTSGRFCFCVEFGGGKKALLHQRMIGNGHVTCNENFTSNWGYELVAKLVGLHDGKIVASQDDFGTHLWQIELPRTRVTVLDIDAAG